MLGWDFWRKELLEGFSLNLDTYFYLRLIELCSISLVEGLSLILLALPTGFTFTLIV
jgi:hypothetical protein